MTVLLDTDVISETTRHAPDLHVLRYLTDLEHAFVSVISEHELHYGICRLPLDQRRTKLATRNATDFAGLGLTIVDPWVAPNR